MLQLNNREKLHKKRKRIGRGGDLGGTSGKGHKGQKARSGGGVHLSFEGGQMPLSRRLPRRGFNNKQFRDEIKIVSLEVLERHFDDGAVVSKESLFEKNIVKGKSRFRIKILSDGTLTKKITVQVDMISASAREKIEKAGGQVEVVKE
jgi:large subunit ribosomal protein L15